MDHLPDTPVQPHKEPDFFSLQVREAQRFYLRSCPAAHRAHRRSLRRLRTVCHRLCHPSREFSLLHHRVRSPGKGLRNPRRPGLPPDRGNRFHIRPGRSTRHSPLSPMIRWANISLPAPDHGLWNCWKNTRWRPDTSGAFMPQPKFKTFSTS